MTQAEGRAAKCCIHLLKFARLSEFPDDNVDLSDVLATFKAGRCNARTLGSDGRVPRIPMCAEDVAETGCDDLFDEDGFLVAICPRHAELVMARAVDGRACTGSVCGGTAYGIDAASDESPVSQPQCGRRHLGARIYCETCFQVRAETGKTPAKPVRSFRGTSSDVPSSREAEVSPLTESGDGSRSGNVLTNVFGLVGAALGAEAGVGERSKTIGSLSWPSPGSGADDTTVVDLPSSVPAAPAAEDAELSSSGANGRGDLQQILDMLSGVSSRLGDIERRQDRSEDQLLASVDAKLARAFSATASSEGSALGAGSEESKVAPISESEADADAARRSERFRQCCDESRPEAERLSQLTELFAQLDSQRAALEASAASAASASGVAGAVLSATKGARLAGADVMSRLRGLSSHVDDEQASPAKRLSALMTAVDGEDGSPKKVTRSPSQMKARSETLIAEVESEEEKMAAVVRDLGPALVRSHGVYGAAERIAGLYDELSVEAVALALAHQDAGPESGGVGAEEEVQDEEDEVSEAASELDDEANEIVGYVRADRTTVAAELLEEFTLADGRCSVRLRLLESGVIKRLSGSDLARVHRDWQELDHEDGKARAGDSSLAGASETEAHARGLLGKGVITDVEFAQIVGKDRAIRRAAADDGKAPAWTKSNGGAAASCADSSVSPQTQSGSVLSKRLDFGSPAEAVLDKAKMLHAKGVPGSDVVGLCEMTAQRVGCEWSSVEGAVLRILASPSSPAVRYEPRRCRIGAG